MRDARLFLGAAARRGGAAAQLTCLVDCRCAAPARVAADALDSRVRRGPPLAQQHLPALGVRVGQVAIVCDALRGSRVGPVGELGV
eukprot:1543798-Prymnesium_polylepis.1